MLDAVQPTTDLLSTTVEAWEPDPACLTAGDQYADLMLRCWAAAGLSDQQIVERVLNLVGVSGDRGDPPPERIDAAVAVARHCAAVDMTLAHIIAVLAHLAAEVPCWPDDDISEIAEAAVAERAA